VLSGLLAAGIAAVIAGSRSFAAIGQWAADAGPEVLAVLGAARGPAEESTFRRAFALVSADVLDRVLGAWPWTGAVQAGGRLVVAVDGKTVRGAGVCGPAGYRRAALAAAGAPGHEPHDDEDGHRDQPDDDKRLERGEDPARGRDGKPDEEDRAEDRPDDPAHVPSMRPASLAGGGRAGRAALIAPRWKPPGVTPPPRIPAPGSTKLPRRGAHPGLCRR
jgi:DDE_Tnp_1-associated